MDLVSLSFSVCVMMVCLSGSAQLSSSDNNCPCPEIPQWNLTKPPNQTCFKNGSRFRYKCVDGYVRRSGTSDLIKCRATEDPPRWSTPIAPLECIPDPKITTTTTTTTTQRAITTGKTISTTQMMQNASSAPEEGSVTETTTHETVTQTAGKTETIQSSTPSPRVANISSTPSSSQTGSLKTTTAATISTLILVIVCSLGIIFLLYRRKSKRRVRVPTEDEQDKEKCMNLEVDEQTL